MWKYRKSTKTYRNGQFFIIVDYSYKESKEFISFKQNIAK